MKNKIVITILSIGLVLTAAACGTSSADSEDDTSLVTEIAESNTTDDTADAEGANSTEGTSDADSTGDESGQADTTEAADGTEGADATESIDSAEAGGTEDSGDTDGTESTSEVIPDISEITVTSSDDGITLLKALFGTEDAETGNQYVFIYLNTVTIDDVEYYAYTWSWAVDDHYSRLTDVFVASDGSTVYEGDYDADSSIFNSDDMLTE